MPLHDHYRAIGDDLYRADPADKAFGTVGMVSRAAFAGKICAVVVVSNMAGVLI